RELFPPAPQPSKMDLQLASGEYFLKPDEKKAREDEKKKLASIENRAKKVAEREKAFVAPKEESEVGNSKPKEKEDEKKKMDALMNKFKSQALGRDEKSKRAADDGDVSAYVISAKSSKKTKTK
ncbi:ribosomal RNA assembly protein krr1, partial [Kickxella alabastrina]